MNPTPQTNNFLSVQTGAHAHLTQGSDRKFNQQLWPRPPGQHTGPHRCSRTHSRNSTYLKKSISCAEVAVLVCVCVCVCVCESETTS